MSDNRPVSQRKDTKTNEAKPTPSTTSTSSSSSSSLEQEKQQREKTAGRRQNQRQGEKQENEPAEQWNERNSNNSVAAQRAAKVISFSFSVPLSLSSILSVLLCVLT